jgi:hypothetical protein
VAEKGGAFNSTRNDSLFEFGGPSLREQALSAKVNNNVDSIKYRGIKLAPFRVP